jgi:uncharacterized protein YecE (DUF72 family)
VTRYLIGTGGWAYFPGKPSLRAYSKVFDFVEVNSTFYQYPDARRVELWRKTVPKEFTFSVRCHRDLTHRIGLKSSNEAYDVFSRMIGICRILEAPYLHLETPASYALNEEAVKEAKAFFSTVTLKNVRIAWEIRGHLTPKTIKLMQDFDIVHSVDLSRETPSLKSDVIYSRLFGRGKLNIYQFTDEELTEIDEKIEASQAKIAFLSYHGVRMNSDAMRFKAYKLTGEFPSVTGQTGAESAKAVLSEDAKFPSTRAELLADQGWKVVDFTEDKRIHLSEMLSGLPERRYNSLDEVVQAMRLLYG